MLPLYKGIPVLFIHILVLYSHKSGKSDKRYKYIL